jgi:hypothetical protein
MLSRHPVTSRNILVVGLFGLLLWAGLYAVDRLLQQMPPFAAENTLWRIAGFDLPVALQISCAIGISLAIWLAQRLEKSTTLKRAVGLPVLMMIVPVAALVAEGQRSRVLSVAILHSLTLILGAILVSIGLYFTVNRTREA